MLEALKIDMIDSQKTIKEYDNKEGIKAIINKIPKFFAKRELGIKNNMFESLSKKKISTKAITKSAAFFALDWAVGSFAIERFLDIFREKKHS